MKAPAVPVVAALAAGITLGRSVGFLPGVWLACAVALVLAALAALRRESFLTAWTLGLAVWILLGALAASLERAARPRNNAADLIASGRIDSSGALRWRGRLRVDPVRLPEGIRYDIDLDEVEAAGGLVPVSGGLRATLFANAHDPALPPALRAGGRAEFFVRARLPRNYQNAGAFNFRAYYERMRIHLLGTVRAAALVQKLDGPPPTLRHHLARLRGRLLDELDSLFARAPAEAAILRAMLLGDRGFLDHEVAVDFQKTAVYHVLVIAGLHVAALAWFVFLIARWMRLRLEWRIAVTVLVLAAFVAVVEDRPPILRAALMAALALAALSLYRRVAPLNTVATAALGILAFKPSALADPSFQLSFLAVGTIAAIGAPWIQRSSEPYRRALEHLGDVTRDPAHAPRAAQFRLDARGASRWLEPRLPKRVSGSAAAFVTLPCSLGLRLWEMCLLSAVLQIGMLPLLAADFHRVSLSGALANVPAVVLTGLIVPLGFLMLGAGLVWSGLAAALARVLGWLVALLEATVKWFARSPRFSYRIPGPPLWLLIAFVAVLILLGIVAHNMLRNLELRRSVPPAAAWTFGRWVEWALVLALAVLGLCIATFPFAPDLPRGRLEANVLDVGQGDSIFLAFPGGRTMLIDGGGVPGFGQPRGAGVERSFDVGEQVVSPYLWERGLKHLDVVMLSHAHEDHLGGLGAVLENFNVSELWVGRDVLSPAFHDLLAEAKSRGTAIVFHRRGDSFAWQGVTGRVLWPDDSSPAAQGSNDDSLVVRLEYQRTAFLLPGDIERRVEDELAARGEPLHAEFLKIPHHGSSTSSTPEFLSLVSPQVEVISAGEGNPYGHPSAEVLTRLAGHGARLLRTDRDGEVSVTSDGRALRVRSFAGESSP